MTRRDISRETGTSGPHVEQQQQDLLNSSTRRARVARTTAIVIGVLALGIGIGMAASTVVTDTTNVRLRIVQNEYPQGYDSGWHTHPGPAIVQVQEGIFKIYQGGCEPKVVHEGESYIEIPLVPVRAISKGYIKYTTSFILPATEPDRTIVPGPCG